MDSPISSQEEVTETAEQEAGSRGDLVKPGDALVENGPGMLLSDWSAQRGDHVLQGEFCPASSTVIHSTIYYCNLVDTRQTLPLSWLAWERRLYFNTLELWVLLVTCERQLGDLT